MAIPQLDSFDAAVTYVSRTTGASTEDAERVVKAVGAFAIAEYRSQQPEPILAPQGVTMAEVKLYVDGRLDEHRLSDDQKGQIAKDIAETIALSASQQGALR